MVFSILFQHDLIILSLMIVANFEAHGQIISQRPKTAFATLFSDSKLKPSYERIRYLPGAALLIE